jgi:Holliday junction resolvasome RuvABC endonuclease subunit
MKQHSVNNQRVLAIDPTSRGFGFAVLESSELIDYGIREAKGNKNSVSLKKIADLIELYQPQIIVLENPTAKGSRRCLRVQELIREIKVLGSAKKVMTRCISRLQVKKAFALLGAATKYQIAVEITKLFPELEVRLPRIRKPWMSEDERMSIFDATALALTFCSAIKKKYRLE